MVCLTVTAIAGRSPTRKPDTNERGMKWFRAAFVVLGLFLVPGVLCAQNAPGGQAVPPENFVRVIPAGVTSRVNEPTRG